MASSVTPQSDPTSVLRALPLIVLAILPACASVKSAPPGEVAHSGTVQRAYPVTTQGKDLPYVRRLLGKYSNALAPKLRHSGETNQYVLRTPAGQVMAQSDDEFEPGDCVDVVPLGNAEGPAYRLGQAQLLPSDKCATLTAAPSASRGE
jgi:hypothetical protein